MGSKSFSLQPKRSRLQSGDGPYIYPRATQKIKRLKAIAILRCAEIVPARVSAAYARDIRRAFGRMFRPLGRTGFGQRHRVCSIPPRLSNLPRAGSRLACGVGSLKEALRFADRALTHGVCVRELALCHAVACPASQLPASPNLIRY